METYLDAVGVEAVKRAGKGPQLKGVIHEVMVRDSRNLSLERIVEGHSTELVHSTTARTVDLVTSDASGKVVRRLQVKDVTSTSGLRDVGVRVRSGQYRSARLVGTEETCAGYAKRGLGKHMERSGVSSTTTTRAADNAGAAVRNRDLLLSNAKDIAKWSGAAAGIGAAVGGVAEAVSSYKELRDGEIDGVEYAGRITVSTVKGGASAAVKTGAALGLKEAGKAIAKQAGSQTLRRVAGSNPATAVAFGVVEQVWDTGKLVTGSIDGAEYGKRTCQNVGGVGGAIAGAEIGALVGSVVPGAGTVVGAVVGGIIGGIGGSFGGRGLGRLIWA
jgi:hypothetical protein